MDVNASKALRDELSMFIAEEIRKFESRTGLVVEDVDVIRHETLNGSSRLQVVVEVKL